MFNDTIAAVQAKRDEHGAFVHKLDTDIADIQKTLAEMTTLREGHIAAHNNLNETLYRLVNR